MNSLDRVLGTIYKDISYSDVINSSIYSKNGGALLGRLDLSQHYNLFHPKMIECFKEIYLKNYYENYSADEVGLLLDWSTRQFFNKQNCSGDQNFFTGIHLIKEISKKYLNMTSEGITVSFDYLLEWNGFINKVDSNIFYAAYLSVMNIDESIHNHELFIHHDNRELRMILRKGISENHMHLKGSGYSIDWSWIGFLMDDFSKEESYSKNLGSKFDYKTINEVKNEDLAYFKLRIIHFYIWSRIRCETEPNLKDNIISSTDVMRIIELRQSNYSVFSFLKVSSSENEKIVDRLEYWQNDFANDLDENASHHLYPVILQRKVYKYIFDSISQLPKHSDDAFLFHTYLMGVNQFKLSLLQDNRRIGFSEFKNYEDIKTEFMTNSRYFRERNIDVNALIYQSVFDKYYRDDNVILIEFRVTPRGYRGFKKLIDQLERINTEVYDYHKKNNNGLLLNRKTAEKIKFGIIFHYIKGTSKGITSESKLEDTLLNNLNFRQQSFKDDLDTQYSLVNDIFDNASPRKKIDQVMFEEEKKDFDNGDSKLISFYDTNNVYLQKLVGIDTANYEIGYRPELFSKVYNSHKNDNKTGHKLHFTYHVGEDFITIANGLRAIDEVLEFLNFSRGDRLGHAMALGLDVNEYFKTKRYKVHSNIEDYIDDIVWMYQLFISENIETTRLESFLLNEFEKYKRDILPKEFYNISINDYINLYKKRSQNNVDTHIGKSYSLGNNSQLDKDLFCAYQHNKIYQKNSIQKLIIDIHQDSDYIKCVIQAQEVVRSKIIFKKIRIETNPSSNFKISFIRKLIDLPLFSFNTHLLEENQKGNIGVSINTDDSSIFQTNLSMEYSIVAAALLKEGYPEEKVMDYIDMLREQSLRQSFVHYEEYQ